MHSSMGWYHVAYWQKATASVLTILSLVVMTAGPLLVPTVALATSVVPECNAAASHEVVSDTATTNTGDDPSGNSVAVTSTAVTTSAWTASIPGATWIWSTAAIADGTVDNTETFTRSFTIVGAPAGSATLAIAADNYYTVSVNGSPIGGEMADENNFSTADSYPVTNLVNGVNTITVVAKNKGIPGDAINNPAGVLFKLSYTSNDCLVKVHMLKYVQIGNGAPTQVADDSGVPSFPMNATWQTANLNGGASASGDYVLGNNHGGTALKYAADTSPMTAPANYSTYEVTGGNSPVLATDTACAPGKYRLLGYKIGDTLQAAEGASITAAAAFTGLSADKYVIVVNEKCADTVTVQNSCPLPDALTDVTAETLGASPSGEETLQQILNGESYGVNATTDQKQFQVWNVTPGSSVLIDPIKFVDKFAGHNQVFGYYTNGDTSNFVPVFKTGAITGQESVPLYTAGPFTVTVPVGATTIGFAIKSFSGNSLTGTFATQNALNTAGEDHVLVYNPSANKYALAFEDLTAAQSSDNDYNDLVVEVTLHCQAVCEADVNLLTNPSFESPTVVDNGGTWQLFPTGATLLVWAVRAVTGVNTPSLEIQRHYSGWLAAEGEQFAELDSTESTSIYQDIATIPGKTYKVAFDFAARPDASLITDNAANVFFGGAALASVSSNTIGANATVWQHHEYTVVATSTSTRVEFTDAGTSNSLGSFVDKVSVSCVPPPPNTATISAKKIVCDAESYLPNWGAGGGDITATTAADFLATGTNAQHCHLADWTFDWSADGVGNPGDNTIGSGGAGWTAFTTTATVPAGARVWVREEPKTGYVPFTGQNTNQSVSAELYCSTDVLNYDNWDFIDPVVAGTTCHCVGFNAPAHVAEEPTSSSETIVVSSNTSAGENLLGWMFNRDLSTQSPYAFNTTAASIGTGSLFVNPITNTVVGNGDKFIGELFLLKSIADVNSITYDFKIAAPDATVEEQFYMNVYANFGVSSPTKFYDCRYSVVPTVGSTGSFTTVTFDPTQAYPVTTRTGGSASPFPCPAIPADMDTVDPSSNPSVIRVVALNVGDTSGSDTGVSGNLDKVVTSITTGLNTHTTTYDFEPASIVVDHCANIAEVQSVVPEGMVQSGENCITPETPPTPPGPGGGGPIQGFSFLGGGISGLGGGSGGNGQVAGASCGLYLDKHLKFGSGKNNKEQVKKLQSLLNKYGFGPIPVTGVFGPATLAAVKAFQAKYTDDVLKPWGINAPTGLVYLSTLIKINLLECPDLTLPLPPLVPWSANPNAQ